ncbi:Hypothetical predicted protein, partial [Paramuricea clavata]
NRAERKHESATEWLEAYTRRLNSDLRRLNVKSAEPVKIIRGSTGKQIIVKIFPGATTEDMKYYVKPTLERNPELVVLHVGTNYVHAAKGTLGNCGSELTQNQRLFRGKM